MKAPRNIECENARKLIDLAVTGDVSADEGAVLNAHLVECEDCRRRLAARKALWENYPVGVYPSGELLQKTLASVANARKPTPRSILSLRPSLASLAASVLIVVGALYAFGLLPVQRSGGNRGETLAKISDEALIERLIALQEKHPDQVFAIDMDTKTIQVRTNFTSLQPAVPTGGSRIGDAEGPRTVPVTFVH